jgi:predicted TPR repeat methyltransferase
MSATTPVHDPDAALQLALVQHQRGELDKARQAYLAILEKAPGHADTLHLLGVVARQQGDSERATELIGRAIAIDPRQATMHCNLGAAWQDLGAPDKALDSYDAALALVPAYALAWSNRGNSLRQLGRSADACASYGRALALRANYPEALCNLAIALHDLGRDDEALAASDEALRLRPRYLDALCARANALHGLQRYAEAVDGFDAALAIDGRHAQAWCWRGIALQKSGRFADAAASYREAITLRPAFADAHQYLGNALRALDDRAGAVAAWREALALGGDADALGFAIASLDAGQAPATAPAGYVKALFDDYADRFDAHLVGELGYRTPDLIGTALAGLALPDGLATLDLGCGTGLCAPILRPRSRLLVGVDLSANMLDKARARGDYDVLDCAEIGAWLTGRETAFDLVVAADVLVYFGDLAPLMGQVSAVLHPDGWFVFSIETQPGDGFVLQASSRYAHAIAYVERVAQDAGLRVHAASAVVLRHDRGQPVHGHVMVLRKSKGANEESHPGKD